MSELGLKPTLMKKQIIRIQAEYNLIELHTVALIP